MQNYHKMLENNRAWAARVLKDDTGYFGRHEAGQRPHFFFIGCCDSRVPAELLLGAGPGELFTYRNIANQAHPNDLGMLSALEYAVEFLDVKHVMVCGHHGCGGVKAAMGPHGHGVVDHWLHVVRDVYRWHEEELEALPDDVARTHRMVELNVIEQVFQLSRTPVVQRAWAKGQRPILHGLVYDLHDGLLNELVTGVDSDEKARLLGARVTSRSIPQRT